MYHTGLVYLVKIQKNYVWAVLPSEKREARSSSQHGDAIGCSLSPCCKFEINLRSYATYLAGGGKNISCRYKI